MRTTAAVMVAVLACIAAAATCLLAPGYYAYLLGMLATTALAGIGLNVLLGLAGEVSLGQGGFVALGAYGVGILTTKAGLNFWAALPFAVLMVAVISAALSIPALRVTGPYLAMVTIAFGFIVESVSIEWRDLTGGSSGLAGISAPFGTGGTALLACAFCLAGLVLFYRLARSPVGLAMQAFASAPAAACGVGISPVPVRTAAFVLAAATAGLAGGLQAALTGFIAPSSFPFSQSILLLLVVVIGGAGWSLGPLIGSVIVVLLPEALASLAEYRLLIFGAALLVVLWAAPGGIAGALAQLLRSQKPVADARPDLDRALAHITGARGSLVAEGVRIAFGGVVAVAGVDMLASPGRITSVIGPNGAGKTTLLNLMSGFQRPDAGTVRVGKQEVTRFSAHEMAAAGLARTFQTAQPFANLSVLDNVRLGLLRGAWRGRADSDLARALLALVGYAGSDATFAATLPHVDRRLVEIARALATSPAVLLLDEPAAGLNEADTAKLGALLQRLARVGLAVVLVEHDMSLVMSISDEIVVLDAGRRIAVGAPAVVRNDPAVKAAYLGAAMAAGPAVARNAAEPLLDVNGLGAGYGALAVLDSVSLKVGRGEVIALFGPNGAGKSTLMKALSGLIRPVSGSIKLDGKDLASLSAPHVARSGLILVPEGRQVFPKLTVAENLCLGATRRSDFSMSEIEGMLQRFPRLRPRLHTAAGLLSGGEQQMLAVARGLLAKPEILMLDEPSLGLAPAIVSELFEQFARLRDEGMTLLIVDQMAEYALAIADRGYVLGGGRVVAQGTPSDLRGAMLDDAYLGSAS
ncbi:branched-chain amino acid ABC transporter ATP-binding protein/permease [Bradyrhizobium sp.]|uniref:branched-chain amino acid ABC transporter ATP-binding protein/permease n=1 Tax=Bradyrhizobium sp. TaxID=376 RepID=UPI0023A1E420|nr:branched-chain amino acid ABC transporter ATP-binding protein/permease [Bradyrhizobium sp.]MDE1934483.1 ATP-binding cassette domain-containing protein [Bradyrhizobium sp.]